MAPRGNKSALARELDVSRGMLHYRHKQPDKDEALRRSIEAVMLKHPGYGHKRAADDLQTWQRLWIALLEKFSVFKSMTEHSIELVERALKIALLGADQASAWFHACAQKNRSPCGKVQKS